jgi:hypothetical protein
LKEDIMDTYLVPGIIALVVFSPIIWWGIMDIRSSLKYARKEKERKAKHAEARRNFKRKIYPALEVAPHPACGNAPAIPTRLDLRESLASDTSAFMSCQVLLDGEDVHGPFSSWLEGTTNRRIRRLADVEAIAKRYAHQEWLIKFVEPLQSLVYQRHADGQWNLVRVGTGMF